MATSESKIGACFGYMKIQIHEVVKKFRVSNIQELTDHRPTHKKRKTKLDQEVYIRIMSEEWVQKYWKKLEGNRCEIDTIKDKILSRIYR